mmetsp:Transcript_113714/g.361323  ORF Transcript_113714/g.361323 Transcript_113714/m.361323 type:complete len:427 (-) Transcript_113714:154-1434(-)
MWWNTGPHLARRLRQQRGEDATKAKRDATWHGTVHKSDVDEFKAVLKSKFGSVTRAWRLALDADNSGVLDFSEFCLATKSIGYIGDLRTLWFNMDRGTSGNISLNELDGPAALALEKFRVLATRNYGSIEDCWKRLVDEDASGFVQLAEFCSTVGQLGYDGEEEMEELFHLLMIRPGTTTLTLGDVMFLQKWHETKREEAYRKRMPVSWVNRDPNLYLSALPGATDSLPPSSFGKEPDSFKNLRVQRRGSVCIAFDGKNQDKEKDEFCEFLVDRYGSLVEAFHMMDSSGSGLVTMPEFKNAVASSMRYCRHADAKRLFLVFCSDPDGVLTWEQMGISVEEWVSYRLRQKSELLAREGAIRLNQTAPIGTGPRMLGASEEHVTRIRFPKHGRADVAFWKPLPRGWGPPPTFAPVVPTGPHQVGGWLA